MPYIPDPTDVTQPTTAQKASTAAAEFTALKGYIQATILPLIGTKLPATGGNVGALNITSGGLGIAAGAISLAAYDTYGFVQQLATAGATAAGGLLIKNSAGTRVFEALYLSAGYVGNAYGAIAGDVVFNFSAASSKRLRLSFADVLKHTITETGAIFTGAVTATSFAGDGSALTGLPGGSISGAQVIAALGYTPYNNTNPSGFISGINSGMVTTALGFTPYNATNPNAYISGITGGMVNAALGFTPGTNSTGARTVSSSAPSGGVDGDIWYQV